ncbi:hypothetical protein Agabi119p4_2824 [Agaricus bisporus var. burnettii]|uniref:Mid2 domain-containing protein n=2 Tax=Agaricus bisporus var. burnettii TaxID=192524 RepID=A0A8H7KIQ6_AGABI|nr:hypothetical protein Agabi119p4_2824 [Agaricus bisporus var. burnettii]
MPTGSVFFHERYPSLTVFTLFLLYFFTLLQPVAAVLKNVTIDDQKGDARTEKAPKFAPDFAWANQACVGCKVGYDPGRLFDNTATAATFMPDKGVINNTVEFDFNGTAIYIFFTLFYNEGEQVTVNTECNFTLDNESPVFFNHSGDPTVPAQKKRDYHTLVFSKTGLEYKPHRMLISMSDVTYHVFLSFDYAQYTIDEAVDLPTSTTDVVPSPTSTQSLVDSPSSSPPSSPSPKIPKTIIGIVVGGVLGGLAVLAGFLGLLLFYRRGSNRSPKRRKPGPATPRPFVYSQRTNPSQSTSSPPLTRAINPTSAPPPPEAARPLSIATPNLAQAWNVDAHRSSFQSLPSYPGSNRPGSLVEHRIRDANRRMQNLTVEIATTSSQSSKARTSSSRATAELVEEVKRLRREIQILKQSQRSPLDPPPQYDE